MKTKKNNSRKKYSKKKRRLQTELRLGMILLAALVVILAIVTVVKWNGGKSHQVSAEDDQDVYPEAKPDIDVELLTVNDYSRPGLQVDEINGIVVHYTANPGSTAMENRDYFEGLKDSQITQASSNFVIGLEGEIVQCVPTWEVAYASNERNDDTISIECCHPDETGEFEDATYNSLVDLCTWLCLKYDLTADDIIRHYDVTGKICPKYFVENEDAWEVFLEDVREKLTEYR